MIKASGRAALVVLAGHFLLFAAAAQAAPAKSEPKSDGASKQADEARPAKHRRQATHGRSEGKTADKASDDKADKTDTGKDTAKDTAATQAKSDNDAPPSSQIPPQVANANAQAADTAAAASAMTNRASDNVQAAADNSAASGAENQVVAPDQLNDVDRTLQQDAPAAQPAAVAATDPQPRPAPVMASSGQQSSAWDQSSLIGKIFIGFGALLTLASAARMFMA
jgi:hypothetical protein